MPFEKVQRGKQGYSKNRSNFLTINDTSVYLSSPLRAQLSKSINVLIDKDTQRLAVTDDTSGGSDRLEISAQGCIFNRSIYNEFKAWGYVTPIRMNGEYDSDIDAWIFTVAE